MKLSLKSTRTIGLFWLMTIAGGCSRQFPSSASPTYPLPMSLEAPIGSAYPGTRELMKAPPNDPALRGVDLMP